MLVSVIVPVYNVEKYIRRCLDSIINQTYTEIEVIIVDDGSTDLSGAICDEYASQDKRIKVIHKDNGGLSSARNAGMEIAQGDYITFVDSDDYLANDYVEESLKLCMEYDAEISILKMEYIAEDFNSELDNKEEKQVIIFSREQAIKESLYQKLYSCCAPCKMYYRSTLDTIQFPINRLSEDLAVCHHIFSKANKVVFQNSIGYYYRQQSDSIMHIFNPRRLDALEWVKEIEDYCKKHYPSIVSAAKCRTFNVAIHLALDLPEKKDELKMFFPQIWKEVKRTRITVLKDSECRFREKAAAICSFLGYKTLKMVWNSKMAVKNTGN